jgi:hypothetical protein
MGAHTLRVVRTGQALVLVLASDLLVQTVAARRMHR